MSRAGSIMGTPSYMAPEQARGEIDLVDDRADVFALGSILAKILTGEPAFTGRTSGEIQRKAALGDTAAALARLEACGADAELITLAKDCLAREREDRPRDASAVSKRITAYLASVQEARRTAVTTYGTLPVRASAGWVGQLSKTCKPTRAQAQLLRRAQQQHPADFWVNNHLGSVLRKLTPPETG